LTGRGGERSKLRGKWHQGLGWAAGEDVQYSQFVGTDSSQAGHATRLGVVRPPSKDGWLSSDFSMAAAVGCHLRARTDAPLPTADAGVRWVSTINLPIAS
jgi:hypothetical protein